jgi:hypothetical protein
MSSSKKLTLLRNYAAGDFLSEAHTEPHTSPPPYTLYTVYCTYSHREGGMESWIRENMRWAQSWVKNTNMIGWKSRKVPLQVNFFRWRHFALVSIKLISPWLIKSDFLVLGIESRHLSKIQNGWHKLRRGKQKIQYTKKVQLITCRANCINFKFDRSLLHSVYNLNFELSFFSLFCKFSMCSKFISAS